MTALSRTGAAMISAALRRYRVHKHYRETSLAFAARYAVFGPDGPIGEPMTHAEAQQLREDLIVADLAQLLGDPAEPGGGGGARPYLGPYPIPGKGGA